MIPGVALRLIYQMLCKLLGLLVLRADPTPNKELEILVLRHQLAGLERRTGRPKMSWTDRALIAALTRLLPAPRRLGLLVTPGTILRWHVSWLPTTGQRRPTHPGGPPSPPVSEPWSCDLPPRIRAGLPAVHGELAGLGYQIGASTAAYG